MSDNLSEETNAAAKLAGYCGIIGGLIGGVATVFNFSSAGISTAALGAATVGVSTWLGGSLIGTLAGGGALFVLSMGSKPIARFGMVVGSVIGSLVAYDQSTKAFEKHFINNDTAEEVTATGSKAEHVSYLEQSETLNLADYSRLIAKQPKLTA